MTMTAGTPSIPPGIDQPRSWDGCRPTTQLWILTAKSVRPMLKDPRLLVLSMLQPLIMLVLFSQVFKSVADTAAFPAGMTYTDYLVPAICVLTAMSAGAQCAAAFCEDVRSGIVTRFQMLPVHRIVIPLARSAAEAVRTSTQLVLIMILSFLVFGFSAAGGPIGLLGAVAVAMTFGIAISWVFLALAVWLRRMETIQMASVITVFPLMFGSNAYVPLEGLPDWLRMAAAINPLSTTISAVRSLALGLPTGTTVVVALSMSVVLGGVALFLTYCGFRNRRD